MQKAVQELFAPPIGLKPIRISGTIFHTSDKIKEKFVLAFEKSSKGRHIANDISRLVENEKVIPCFKSKGIFSFIKNKIFSNPDKNILAFYMVDDKKVVVLIDNSSTIFGTSSNNEIASTTMHECMHLAAGTNLSAFVRIFSSNLNSYYSEYFKEYFKIKNINNRDINEIINYLSEYEKRGPVYANRQLPSYFKLLERLFKEQTSYNNHDFNQLLTQMIVACKIFIVSIPSFYRNARNFSMVFSSLNLAYNRAFGERNTYTTPIQELITLSEVACVLSEMNSHDSSIKQIFRIIR